MFPTSNFAEASIFISIIKYDCGISSFIKFSSFRLDIKLNSYIVLFDYFAVTMAGAAIVGGADRVWFTGKHRQIMSMVIAFILSLWYCPRFADEAPSG